MSCLLASSIPVSSADSTQDIPTNAAGTGIHDTLVAALAHVDLVTTLEGTGPFTVFAPTDQAFTDAGVDLANFQTAEEKAVLTDILLYHVVAGAVPASAVTDGMLAEMVNGDKAKFTVDGTVSINDATVIQADVQASNGIIHVIDKVLTPPVDIPATAQTTGIHDILVDAVIQADLLATLQTAGPFTLFAPTDQAFIDAEIDLAALDTTEGKAALADILLYHVVPSEVPASAITDGMLAEMANGDKIKITADANGVSLGGATVTMADVVTSNGLIHVIDKVLTPPVDIPATAQTTGIHDSLVAAVIQAELLTTLQGDGPFTVFAPTDQAFIDAEIDLAALDTTEGKAALADILLYHVVPSEVPSADVTDCMSADAANTQPLSFTVADGVMVNDANVVLADVVTSNGLIHVIDKVLTPTDTPRDIPRTAQCTGAHDSLVAALVQAELVATLQGDGPFTVFAPTDQAFTDAGIDLAALDTPEGKATLTDILLHHVVAGEVPASAVTDGMLATMVNGDKAKLSVTGDVVSISGATVTGADVATANGIIHVIDKVMMPPGDVTAIAQGTGIHDSLVAAVIQAELLTTLQGDGPFTVFAPTDQAFADAGIDLTALDTTEGKAALSDILLYHVVSAEVASSDLSECQVANAANGQPLSFTVGETVMVNGATVTIADVPASNGIVHVIDKVLTPSDTPNDLPRTAQCTGIHNSLVAAVIQAELLTTLQGEGPFTLFAPTDQAFADAGIDLATLDTPEGKANLSDILLYHVVPGAVPSSNLSDCMSATAVNDLPLSFTVAVGSVMVNDATVVTPDVATSNGIIHVIDKVLTPTSTPTDVPRTAACTGVHNSLVAAVIQAELLSTLEGEGPFTVFAPTDQAFIDAGIDLAALNTPEGKATLTDILLHHVHPGSLWGAEVTDGMMLAMANGDNLTLTKMDGKVMIGDVEVTTTDVLASNGIIHVVDKVIMPPSEVNDSSDDAESSSDDDSNSFIWIVLVVIILLGGGAGGFYLVRSKGAAATLSKDFASAGLMNDLQPVQPTAYATQTTAQPVQQAYATQATAQPVQQAYQPQPVETVEVVQAQPVVAEPNVLRQWTDEAGYTWRAMDDGNTYWWTGAEWQKYG